MFVKRWECGKGSKINQNNPKLPLFRQKGDSMSSKWSWRKRGVSMPEIQDKIKTALNKNLSYEQHPVLGFPGTTPISSILDIHRMFSSEHANNIGHHTDSVSAEFGFAGTQELEREFIYTLSHLVGATNPEKDIDGYICMGGTEGNDHGLWLGRNKLRSVVPTGSMGGIAVISSFLAHYSVDKHFERLFNPQGLYNDRDVLVKLPTDFKGELDPIFVEKKIRELNQEGCSRFLLFLSAGTTNMGSVDPVTEICEMLGSLRSELNIQTYVHVDAAFGGFVLPFLEPELKFGFHNQLVDSMVVDAHKMGYAPYSAGVFLCRKGLLEYTTVSATYLGGHKSTTICGSRSGAIAAACWSLTQLMGKEDFEEVLYACMTNLKYLRERLQELNDGEQPRVKFFPARMNIQAVWVDQGIWDAMNTTDDGNLSIVEKYCIPTDLFPADLTKLVWKDKLMVRELRVIRFTAMPHLTREKIDLFIDELKAKMA